MLNENTSKFLREKRKNQVKEDNRERKREKREQIVLTKEQNKSKYRKRKKVLRFKLGKSDLPFNLPFLKKAS